MNEKDLQAWRNKIDKMTQLEMAKLRRFAPSGHPVFNTTIPLFEYFEERFSQLGGMTPSVSKAIGWGD